MKKASLKLAALAWAGLTASAAWGQGIIYGTPSSPIVYSAGLRDDYEDDIDINGDGIVDFAILSTSGSTAYIKPLGNNSLIGWPEPPPNIGYLVWALNQGDAIGSSLENLPDPTLQWYNNQTDFIGKVAIGAQVSIDNRFVLEGFIPWQPISYVGIDLVVNGDNYYGWIQLTSPYSMVYGEVVDWAYQSMPNTPILAGAGAPTPEPSTWVLLSMGGLALGFLCWRRRGMTT